MINVQYLKVSIIMKIFPLTQLSLPLFLHSVPAGFPSPADDYLESDLDLNTYLIKHPAATYLARAKGHSMEGCGIFDGDLLIVDRSLEAQDGQVIIAASGTGD